MNKNNNISASFLQSATPCTATTPSRFATLNHTVPPCHSRATAQPSVRSAATNETLGIHSATATATRPITQTVRRLVISILALTLALILTATLLGQPMQQAHAAENFENPFGSFFIKISDLDGNLILDTKGNGSGSISINTLQRGIVVEIYYPPFGSSVGGLQAMTDTYFSTPQTPSRNGYSQYAEAQPFIKDGKLLGVYTYIRRTETGIANVSPETQYKYAFSLLYANDGRAWNPDFTTYLYFTVNTGDGTGLDESGSSNGIGSDLKSSFDYLAVPEFPEGITPSADTTRYININTNSGLPDTTFGAQQSTALDSTVAATGTSNIANQFASGKLYTVKGAPADELLNPVENPQVNATDLVILGLPYLYVALSVVLATCLPAGLLIRFAMFKRRINS